MSVLSDMQAERGIPAMQAVAGGNALHTRYDRSTQTFVAAMDEHANSSLRDDTEGRHSDLTATLIVPIRDVSGAATEIDDSGTFTIDGLVWQIAGVSKPAGAFQVELKRRNNKTMKTIRRP